MRRIIYTVVLLVTNLPVFGQTINASKSQVTFEVGNMGFNTVEGKLKKMKGNVVFTLADLSSAGFDVCVDASTIDTKNKRRDEHLKNEDFFHVEKYPQICFRSESIVKQDKAFIAKGKLTMHGITRTIEIPFSYAGNTLIGTLTVNRYDYDIGLSTSKFMVSQDVSVKITCVIE